MFTLKTGAEQIMAKLRSANEEAQTNAVKFLVEICDVAKNVPSEAKTQFFTDLVNTGLIECLTTFLRLESPTGNKASLPDAKPSVGVRAPEFFQDSTATRGPGRVELMQVWSAGILTNVLQVLPRMRAGMRETE